MADILLAVTNVALLATLAWLIHSHAALTRRMLNQIAAKDTHELVFLNKIDDQPAKRPVGSEERKHIHPIGA